MPGLFHPRVIARTLATHAFPPDLDTRAERLAPWLAKLENGELPQAGETRLYAPFLKGLLGGVLGYRNWDDGPEYDLEAQAPVKGGKIADAALGWFAPGRFRIHAAVELEGASSRLDAAGSRVLTPVQQAWDYANRAPGSRWVVVSNYKETRLYSTARSPQECEVFHLANLARPEAFRRFWLLLSRDSLLPTTPSGRSLLDDLLDGSAEVERDITDQLYADYRGLRRGLFETLCRQHPNLPRLELVGLVQTLLDRFLFIAFAEDRKLLPKHTLRDAINHRNRFDPRPIWENLKVIFRWIDQGNPSEGFSAYNGGLFADDLSALSLDDATCRSLEKLATYDFREDVSVDVLGHIFEQSITDLEELRSDEAQLSKRNAEGVFYTPAFVTRYIVEQTLGRTFKERFERVLAARAPEQARGEKRQNEAWIAVWQEYRDSLRNLRVLDPACGSGAFLIAAFDALHAEYERVNASLAALQGGQHGIFDLDKTILNQNLFGMDLNRESVEITKLSLWLKTASEGNKLTWLDGNIRCGNSVVSDPRVHGAAIDWTGERPYHLFGEFDEDEARQVDERWLQGFDVVLGNPPYVRQELLSPYKEHWRDRFRAFDGAADIYVYFFELGLDLLKPGGRLGFVVTNKWMKGAYAAPLRGMLAERTEVECVIDFGHAPIFPDADAFPSIITFRKAEPPAGADVEVTQFPREQLKTTSVPVYVRDHARRVPQARFSSAPWSLEGDAVEALMAKLRERGVPLREFAGVKPYRGVLTGYNEAFLIDDRTRQELIRQDAGSAELIRPFLRGENVDRWAADWDGEWIITIASSENRRWPWTGATDPEAAFQRAFPAVYERFKLMEARLRPRTDQGRHWWELRSCSYYDQFTLPKLVYQEIQFHPCYAIDREGRFTNNTAWMIPSADPWLPACLNTPLLWWHNFRHLQHAKDEALRPFGERMESVPIAPPSPESRATVDELVPRVVDAVAANHKARREVLDALTVEYGLGKPGEQLARFHRLDADAFVREVSKRRTKEAGKLRPSALGELRALHARESHPILAREQLVEQAERQLSDLVNAAYGLTDEDVALLRETAPPRMPPGLPG